MKNNKLRDCKNPKCENKIKEDNNKYVLCSKCRSNNQIYKDINKFEILEFNKQFKFFKVSRTGGSFNFTIKLSRLKLGNKVKQATNLNFVYVYLLNAKTELEKDIRAVNRLIDERETNK